MNFPSLKKPVNPSIDRVLKDYANPKSVVNLVTPEVREQIMGLPDKHLDQSEEELEKMIGAPSESVQMLRIMFWNEYDRAMDMNTSMDMTRVYTGVMTRQGFYHNIKDQSCMAWIITPPKEYDAQLDALIYKGLKRCNDVFELPLVTAGGYVDPKVGDLIVKTLMFLDMRKKGGFIHRSMQLTHNVNESLDRAKSLNEATPPNALAIDEQILELEKKLMEPVKITQLDPGQHLTKSQNLAIEVEYSDVTEKTD
jgi:hypothetical protein